ncbi:MAG: hypothetical protein SPF03_10425 [Faecalimonas umbilicata]|uniref:hypothetical protein n=2 Tax=Faecalimonas umbilicata TaxID=1912855 RepID=UPI00242DC180|nr:hypothetical protein [Faecalimonas umbilicata]MCI5986602.1 hypothetical protein [Faecalimonas umbilicata]MDY5093902.1 hypothetical protein [Faecalimonas umbilicata]
MKREQYHYFVEGEDDRKVVNTLKTDLQWIKPGKVQVFNVIEEELTSLITRTLKPGTIVVLVFDTDTGKKNTLLKNIRFLQKDSNVKQVLCIMQVKNLEDEFLRSCAISQIKELTGSKSNSDYKRDLLRQSNLADKLKKHQFQFEKFWNSSDKVYESICNDSAQIKIKNNLFLKKNVEIGKDKGNEQRIHELYIHCKMQ